ncbi:RidA family protein [Gluconacetobacter azotocaptans]|uniref:RidA family protein n=1 Tax=Gluconacetobacter azotocaptans TaxID=142834 RepID=A0A7W4JQH4_9PROT|nr:RidA family protein [Gluconacetobacter azotocaptans]MBB2189036.1 RidA family protein [Gluconacetobacter azotocaptans]MBM9402714.1 RidA family protein [Gluconacetobacter azotocaptans]GBQ26951.1 endoribonuclease L-PSP [Gluconacetobacter azotocaptans DSM 13594]
MDRTTHIIAPPNVPAGSGWSHVVAASGTFVAISGQVSVDAEGRLVGKDDVEAQIHQVYRNLAACLEAINAGFEHVIKLTYYATDIKAALPLMRRIRPTYIGMDKPPANTFVEVTALASPDFLFEAEAFVVL